MSKTTDALDWAYERGRAMGRIAAERAVSETSYSIPTEPPVDPWAPEPEATGVDPMDDPELQDVSPIPGYDAEAVARKEGWNEALDFARDEILENFDTLVGLYANAALSEWDQQISGNGRDAVLAAIETRVSELKK